MDNLWHVYSWFMVTFSVWYHIRNYRPRASRKEFERLRMEALRIAEESPTDYFSKSLNLAHIADAWQQRRYTEQLRMFIRLEGKRKAIEVDSMVEGLRFYRARLRTNLTSQKLTDEQIRVYFAMDELRTSFPVDSELTEKQKAKKRLLMRMVVFYAVTHPELSDRIIRIVEERGIFNMKDIKELLKDMDDTPSSALSEGML